MTRHFARKFREINFLAARVAVFAFAAAMATTAAAQNPVPFISRPLVPDAVAPGGPGFSLIVNGTGFVPSSIVTWDGRPRATTFFSSSRLTAEILASDVATASTATITVVTPGPGGGMSGLEFFPIATPEESILFQKTDFSPMTGTLEVVTADFDGDGILDLAFAGSEVRIFLGNGDGTFRTGETYPACQPAGLALGDFNGDGFVDLVVADSNCSEVTILLGNGDGTFRVEGTFPTKGPYNGAPYSVAVGDFNADGKLDLVTADATANTVSVFLGNGDGTFQPSVTHAVSGNPLKVETGDFNGDGVLDLAVSSNNGVSVLLGKGNGGFYPQSFYSLEAPGHTALAIADLNGDGILDLAAGSAGLVNGQCAVSILTGNADGSFKPGAIEHAACAAAIAAADFNGDGTLDVAVTNYFNSHFGLFPGKGDGTFYSELTYSSDWPSRGLAVGDFNGDGRLDVAVANQNGPPSIFLQTPGQAASLVNLYPSVEPSLFGQAVTFTAQVTSGYGRPTGTVIFYDGSTELGSATLVNENATLTTSSLSVGTHQITAAYQATDWFAASSNTQSQIVTASVVATTTTVTSSRNPAIYQQPVTFTAVVTAASGVPTGAVSFYDFGHHQRLLGRAGLINGSASFTTSSLPRGSHSITAYYEGAPGFTPSTSPVLIQIINLTGRLRTYISESSSPRHSALVGQSITFTATVGTYHGSIPNGETVSFYAGRIGLGAAPLVNGTATLVTGLPAGHYLVSAIYFGDDIYLQSGTKITLTVNRYATQTKVVSSLNPALYGQPVTYTVTVTSSGPDVPTGKVRLTDIGLLPLVGGMATVTKALVRVGNHAITAEYLEDGNSARSTSTSLEEVVNPAPTAAAITSSMNPSSLGQPVTFTSAITPSTPVNSYGKVTFTAGTTAIGTATLKDNTASITTSALPAGPTTITVTYDGTPSFLGSSASLTQNVQP